MQSGIYVALNCDNSLLLNHPPVIRAIKNCMYAAMLLSLINARTQAADTPTVDQCPGAASWSRSHPTLAEVPQSELSSSKAISEAALLRDLKARVESDQEARKKWVADPKNETSARSVDANDAANLTWLRQLIFEKGFPTAAQVGNEGVHLAWILLQHADQDPKLQARLLPVLEQRFAMGELPANDLARITDRVLVASGKPQRYGTQFDWFSSEFKLPEPDKLAAIDTARSQVGLMPLADYVCTLRRAREKLK
jgi:hypothetical protein